VRVLAVAPGPDFSVADVHSGWCEALSGLGCQVVDFNLGDRLTFYSRARVLTETGDYRQGLDAPQAVQLTSCLSPAVST
jgi:hypothetical protein